MAGGDQSDEERTEAATQRHLDQARDEGQVPVSREVATFASFAAVVLVLGYQSQASVQHLLPDLVALLAHAGDAAMLGQTWLRPVSAGVLGAIIPVLTAAVLAGAAAVLVQTRFLLNAGALQPKFSRINPIAGVKRVFGFNGVVEVVKSLIKLGLLAAAMWIAIRGDWSQLMHLPGQDVHGLPRTVARPVFHLFIAAVCVQGIVAAADLGWVRFRHTRDLRMSKQSIRDELKDTDGNPHVKARIRRIRVMRARKRMMAKVPTATVVITNPTHYAVALAYDRVTNPAPRIVAKGSDSLAARIRAVAEANGVPVVANPPLARALYPLDLDTEIPSEHYKAVAEIIAYVWRLRRPAQAIP
ncbi:EscU/YscU/HrcU family type III secretion system export apparatus switch protein [Rhodopila sp.]|uniref:EscU/YscU/HrcU family type III secretion system export apparatus switch protein n=1 Tax=Rhodopila sp. TaxID=2480087 RepID=UPI003D0E978F